MRESVAWVAAENIEAEVANHVGAELGEVSPDRVARRNGWLQVKRQRQGDAGSLDDSTCH